MAFSAYRFKDQRTVWFEVWHQSVTRAEIASQIRHGQSEISQLEVISEFPVVYGPSTIFIESPGSQVRHESAQVTVNYIIVIQYFSKLNR